MLVFRLSNLSNLAVFCSTPRFPLSIFSLFADLKDNTYVAQSLIRMANFSMIKIGTIKSVEKIVLVEIANLEQGQML